jgi:hypothetical protein
VTKNSSLKDLDVDRIGKERKKRKKGDRIGRNM